MNKGIYCDDHNGGYSGLAGILSGQLEALNALLGVRGDHADQPHRTILTDEASGRHVTLSGDKIELAGPEIVSESVEGEVRKVTAKFASEHQLQEWFEAERAQGRQVKPGKREPVQQYYMSSSGISLQLGGSEGLRAIGYLAQTFLAHHFPDIARASELDAFKEFTLGKSDENFVWWDFETPTMLPQNAFEFGHRVIVGLDPARRSIYARVSLFSALHFAVLFGHHSGMNAQAVIVDIDPLAEHPPNDILERRESSAVAAVSPPDDLTTNLSVAISSGRAQQAFNQLLKRIEDRNRALSAEAMLEKLKGADQMDALTRRELFAAVLEKQSQRILNLMRYVIDGANAHHPLLGGLSPMFDWLIAFDPSTANGLSNEATAALGLARQALLTQMLDDYAGGRLDSDRLAMLIGGGPGAAIVGQAIMEPIISSIPER